jgi:catechol 2,3-dioxygenase-like lactoylglutathione lyase family enzyme
VELICPAEASLPPASTPSLRAGFAHLTFAVDDLPSTLQSLRDRGVTVLRETLSDLGPGVSGCMILDPDALPIELYQCPAGVASPFDVLD